MAYPDLEDQVPILNRFQHFLFICESLVGPNIRMHLGKHARSHQSHGAPLRTQPSPASCNEFGHGNPGIFRETTISGPQMIGSMLATTFSDFQDPLCRSSCFKMCRSSCLQMGSYRCSWLRFKWKHSSGGPLVSRCFAYLSFEASPLSHTFAHWVEPILARIKLEKSLCVLPTLMSQIWTSVFITSELLTHYTKTLPSLHHDASPLSKALLAIWTIGKQ